MAKYDSARTGQAHDNDANRLTTLENITIGLSSSGTTGQFFRGDKTWSNSLIGSLTISDTMTATKIHSNAIAGDTDLTRIPSDNEIALETGNGDGSKSAWIWREKWSNGNYGIFHNNSNDTLHIVGANQSRLSVDLGAGPTRVHSILSVHNDVHAGNFDENIRCHMNDNGWCTIMMCGSENTGDTGTSANSWSLHNNNGSFYLSKNASSAGPISFQNVGNHWQICNIGNDYTYNTASFWVREYNYAGANSDTWGNAPRFAWHWAGRVAAQIGLASNGYLYEAPVTGTSFYKITLDGGSSRKIKININNLPNMGDKIDQLKPVSFIYNYDQKAGMRYGLIYEDTVNIMPDICKEDDYQNGGKIINYIDLIPVLIKEIQSLRIRVKELEEQINGKV